MSKICQKYLFLFSIGLLPLIPLVAGCHWFVSNPPQPEQFTTSDPTAEVESVDLTAVAAEAEAARLAAEAEVARVRAESEAALRAAETARRTAEAEAVRVRAELETARRAAETMAAQLATEVEAARQAAEAARQAAAEAVAPPADPAGTGGVDRTSPVDQTPPVDTTPPVQGGNFSLTYTEREPMTVLVSQVEQLQQLENASEEVQLQEIEEQTTVNVVPPRGQGADRVQPPTAQEQMAQGQMAQQGQRPQGGQRGGGGMPPEGRMQQGGPGGGTQPMQRGPGMQGPPPAVRGAQPAQMQMPARFSVPDAAVVQEPRLEPAEGIRFNFRFAPWREVIEWFADQAALSLQINRVPSGTLNLVDGTIYTPTEALDILNSYLLWQDYSLLRRGNVLFVIYLPDGIPPNLLVPITPDQLDDKGEFEIVRCVFNLNQTTPEIIAAEIRSLPLGPQGSVVALPMSRQIVVTETGGNLRTIRDLIQRIDDPDGVSSGPLQTVEMRSMTGEEAIQVMRALLAIDVNDTSLRTVVGQGPAGRTIYLSGRSDMIERARDVLQQIDRLGENDPRMRGEAQFHTYDVGTADPATVLAVLQTLLVGTPDLRLSLDTRTNGISVLARPAAHATVRETISQMQLNTAPRVDIIPLRRMSPQTAVDTVRRFIETRQLAVAAPTGGRGGEGGGQQQRQAAAPAIPPPTVEPDTMARQIIVRGTGTQIAEIRALLASLGEDGVAGPATNLAAMRTIPLSPTATSLVLEQLRDILPTIDPNINLVAPQAQTRPESVTVPLFGEPQTPDIDMPINIDTLIDETFERELSPFLDSLPMTRLIRLAEQTILAQVVDAGGAQIAQILQQAGITVTVTPNGFVLTGGDPETLDKVEALIRMLSDEAVLGRIELRRYYLTHSTASVVSSTLQTLMGTTTPGLGASGIASVDLPDWQHSELMGLVAMQGGNAVARTGTVTVTVDERLNSLLIQANPVDHKTIEGLLEILDQPNRDDIMNRASPRFLPLMHMQATEARAAVEQAFAHRMQGNRQQQGGVAMQLPGLAAAARGGGGGQQGGGGPQEALAALAAQLQGGGGRGQQQPREQEPQMTVSVHAPTNSLIVSSTESTFLEVKAFVEGMDERAAQRVTVMAREQFIYTPPAVLQQTFNSMLGPAARVTVNRGATQTQFGGGGGAFGGGGAMGMQQRPMGTVGGAGGAPFGGGAMGAGTIGGAIQQRIGGAVGGGGGGIGGAGTIGGAQQRPGGAVGGGAIGGAQQRPAGAIGGGR